MDQTERSQLELSAIPKIGVLFVCTANICRSPSAEAMFRHKATESGIADRLVIDSAGTHDFHLSEPPDARSQKVAMERGYDLSALRARKVSRIDLENFNYVLAMDMTNLTVLHRLGEPDLWQKPKLMMSFSRLYKTKEVPDPYSGGVEGFELVLDMLESATDGLLIAVKSDLLKTAPG
ncbi:MAG: low molecular weight protein-tyrosine-phosphatase [Pseudomonadota bacterium]